MAQWHGISRRKTSGGRRGCRARGTGTQDCRIDRSLILTVGQRVEATVNHNRVRFCIVDNRSGLGIARQTGRCSSTSRCRTQ